MTLAALTPLLGELNDLKRVRVAGRAGSLAERGFRRAWLALIAGEPLERVAYREAARALAATRLAGIDGDVLRDAGLGDDAVAATLRAALDAACGPVSSSLIEPLRDGLAVEADERGGLPDVLERLLDQPRAGATAPGKPRVVLEPPESHADHCWTVAVYAALVGPRYGASDPGAAFLLGLAHHLHNAYLPDGGFTGEELLGEHLSPVMRAFTARALGQLPRPLAGQVEAVLPGATRAEGPWARAFVSADVLDRVLQMRHYERAARFHLGQALEDLDLVHAGPLQAFGKAVLAEAGVWPRGGDV